MTQWSSEWPEQNAAARIPLQRAPLRRTWMQRLLIGVGILSVMATLVAAAGVAWGLQRYRGIDFLEVANVDPAPVGEPSNWLLVGSDSREGIDADDPNAGIFIGEPVDGKRTDTIMIARVDPEGRTIDLLSVPRDLWVPIAGTDSFGRINSAFNGEGGEERLVSTVEDALGIDINHYAEVNFVGFQAVIDALGGVPIWFDNPVRDVRSGLDVPTAGCHTLNGFDALAFARSRALEYHDGEQWRADPTGDLGRTARQQFLIGRLATAASTQLDLTDIGTIDRILRVGGENLVIDNGAGVDELLGLARTFSSVGAEGIHRHSLPVSDRRTSGGAAVLDLQLEAAQPTLDLFRGIEPIDPTVPPSSDLVAVDSFSVEVQNGGRVAGLAGTTAETLQSAGFIVDIVGNAPGTVETTVVRYPSTLAPAAATLGTALAIPPIYERDDSLDHVVLVVAADFAGLAGAEPVPEATTTTTPPETTAPPAPETTTGENEVGVVPGPGPAGTPCA